jgi:hypothetical protein
MIRHRWKHWEVHLGRWHLGRWCAGAPCFLTPNQRHPISAWKVRRG